MLEVVTTSSDKVMKPNSSDDQMIISSDILELHAQVAVDWDVIHYVFVGDMDVGYLTH